MRRFSTATVVAALLASAACGKGTDVIVDIEPGCALADAALVRVDVTLAPTGTTRKEYQAASFFAAGSSHTVVILPRDGSTAVDVDVSVFNAASAVVGSGHAHFTLGGAGEQKGTISVSSACADAGVVDGKQVDGGEGDMACPDGLTRCGAQCIDLMEDVLHCGSCTNPCDLDHVCQAGGCVANCTGGTTLCGKSCVDTNSDVAHCGACATPCGPVAHSSSPACLNGFCAPTCSTGWDDCDLNYANGCEQSLADPKHCGSCGNDCTTLPGVMHASCPTGAACVVDACLAGYADCNHKSDDGCEANLATDAMNCGGCGMGCGTGGGCAGGKCVKPVTFSALSSGTTSDLEGVWAASPTQVYVTGGALSIYESTDGKTFSLIRSTPSSPTYSLRSIFGSSASDIYAVGDAGNAFHGSGSSFTQVATGTNATLDGVWTDSPSRVFIAGYAIVLEGSGSTWTPQPTGISQEWVFGVWGAVGGNVHAVADGGSIAKYANNSWSLTIDGANFYGIWGSSENDIWLVGQQGAISHSSDGGKTFAGQSSGVAFDLQAVWGSGPSDVYAVGQGGTILHSFGDGTWSKLPSGTSAGLYNISGTGPNNVYVVGQAGTILHGM